MASSDSTRTTRARKGASGVVLAEAHKAYRINPLTHGDDSNESVQSVANVLAFMAHAFRSGMELEDHSDVADGAGLILETCVSTLEFHFRKGGAA